MKYFVLLLHLVLSADASSQQAYKPNPDSIAREIATKNLHHDYQYLSIGIVSKGKTFTYNFRQSGGKVTLLPSSQQPVYEIGSVSKTFASYLLAKAIQEKKLSFDQDIRDFLPGSYPNLSYKGTPITFRHLVDLTSRLPNNMPDVPGLGKIPDSVFAREYMRLHASYSNQRFLEDLHTVQLDTLPGVSPAHSNAAARLLTILLENIYKEPYETIVEKHVLSPRAMTHTFVLSQQQATPGTLTGYNGEGWVAPYVPPGDVAAFGIRSDIHDMTNYLAFHLKELSPAVKLTHQAAWGDPNNFALGMNWFLGRNGEGAKRITSDGTTFGFTTSLLLYPAMQTAVVVMTNVYANQSNSEMNAAARDVFERLVYSPVERANDAFGFSKNVRRLSEGLDKNSSDAIELYHQLKKQNADFSIAENDINNWGYYLLQKDKKQKALVVFKLNTMLHTDSWNAFDSYAEALLADGQKDKAIAMYKESIRLNPDNQNGKKILETLLKH